MIELHTKENGRRILVNLQDIIEVIEPRYPYRPTIVRLRGGGRYEVAESYETVKRLIAEAQAPPEFQQTRALP